MALERDVTAPDGRTLHVFDSGPGAPDAPVMVWHHGTPQTGALLDPLLAAAAARDVRLVSYARPSYPGSAARSGRDVASAADDVAAIMDDLGVDRFVVMGASGGGPHVLACAARLGRRVGAVATIAGVAPYSDAYDWFDGMASEGGLRSARDGRAARAAYAEVEEFDESIFTAADYEALSSEWRSLGADAGRAAQAGPDGQIDDDVAYVSPWGFDLAEVAQPALVIQGGDDRVIPPSHATWLLEHLRDAELWLRPRDGHVSILRTVPLALDWLLAAGRAD